MIREFFIKLEKRIMQVFKVITITFFVILTFILTLNMINRFVPFVSITWLEEIIELCFAGLVFYGAAAMWISRSHLSVGDWLSKFLPTIRMKNVYHLVLDILGLVFIGIFLYYSFQLMIRSQEVTAVLQIWKGIPYSSMPVAALVMVIASIAHIVDDIGRVINPE